MSNKDRSYSLFVILYFISKKTEEPPRPPPPRHTQSHTYTQQQQKASLMSQILLGLTIDYQPLIMVNHIFFPIILFYSKSHYLLLH